MKNKIYITLLNYKGWRDTIECLESVFKLKGVNFQILVVDNSPTSESLNQLKAWADGKEVYKIISEYPNLINPPISKPLCYAIVSEDSLQNKNYDNQLLIIKAKENRGFAAGNNIALRYALKKNDFEYCWLLNNDTVVEQQSLKNQIRYLKESASRIGILGSVLVDYFQSTNIQAIGGILNKKSLITKHIGKDNNLITEKQSLKKFSIDYVVGASMLVPKKFLMDVGLLSEDFFLYFEELDWSYRAKTKKWVIDWCPDSLVYHKEGSTIGTSKNDKKRSYISEIEFFKSRIVFFKKYFSNKKNFVFYSILIIMNRIKRFQFKLAIDFTKLLLNNFR